MAQIELHLHTKWLITRQNNNARIKNCCNPRGAVVGQCSPRQGWLCDTSRVPQHSLSPSPQLGLSSAAKPPLHRSGQGKKTSNNLLFYRYDPNSPQSWDTELDLPSGSAWSPGKGTFMAIEPKQQLGEDKSNFQGTGLARQPPGLFQGSALTKTKGQASPQTLPLSSLRITARKMCCCSAREIYTMGKEKPAQDKKKVIVLWLKCHLTPKSTTWK